MSVGLATVTESIHASELPGRPMPPSTARKPPAPAPTSWSKRFLSFEWAPRAARRFLPAPFELDALLDTIRVAISGS